MRQNRSLITHPRWEEALVNRKELAAVPELTPYVAQGKPLSTQRGNLGSVHVSLSNSANAEITKTSNSDCPIGPRLAFRCGKEVLRRRSAQPA
jgi:hypothetical protein